VEWTFGCSSRHQMYPSRIAAEPSTTAGAPAAVGQLSTMAATADERNNRSVRILVATDSVGPMSSRRAGDVIASGWRSITEVSVLPIGDAGRIVAAYRAIGATTSSWVSERHCDNRARADTALVQVPTT
jgi:hypothetical protein